MTALIKRTIIAAVLLGILATSQAVGLTAPTDG